MDSQRHNLPYNLIESLSIALQQQLRYDGNDMTIANVVYDMRSSGKKSFEQAFFESRPQDRKPLIATAAASSLCILGELAAKQPDTTRQHPLLQQLVAFRNLCLHPETINNPQWQTRVDRDITRLNAERSSVLARGNNVEEEALRLLSIDKKTLPEQHRLRQTPLFHDLLDSNTLSPQREDAGLKICYHALQLPLLRVSEAQRQTMKQLGARFNQPNLRISKDRLLEIRTTRNNIVHLDDDTPTAPSRNARGFGQKPAKPSSSKGDQTLAVLRRLGRQVSNQNFHAVRVLERSLIAESGLMDVSQLRDDVDALSKTISTFGKNILKNTKYSDEYCAALAQNLITIQKVMNDEQQSKDDSPLRSCLIPHWLLLHDFRDSIAPNAPGARKSAMAKNLRNEYRDTIDSFLDTHADDPPDLVFQALSNHPDYEASCARQDRAIAAMLHFSQQAYGTSSELENALQDVLVADRPFAVASTNSVAEPVIDIDQMLKRYEQRQRGIGLNKVTLGIMSQTPEFIAGLLAGNINPRGR